MSWVYKACSSIASWLCGSSSLGTIEGTMSPLSGIVVPVTVGGQPLYVALDFTDTESFVFAGPACPPLLGTRTCFQPDLSDTLEVFYTFAEINEVGDVGCDTVKIGRKSIAKFPLKIPMSAPLGLGNPTVRFRDVQGSIGASLGSSWLERKILRIGSQGLFNVVVEEEDSDPGPDMVWVNGQDAFGKWSLNTQMELTGPVRVRFDPSVDGLVLPMNRAADFTGSGLHAFAVNVNNELVADCAFMGVVLSVIGADIHVNLRGLTEEQLWASDNEGSCRQGIVFSANTENAVIGRALLRAVQSLFLDYNVGRIGFEPIPDHEELDDFRVRRYDSHASPPPIPLFSLPIHVSEEENTIEFPRTDGVSPGTFVLLSDSTVTFTERANQLECVTFVRFSPLSPQRERSVYVFGNGLEMMVRDTAALFTIEPGRAYRIAATNTGKTLRVCKSRAPPEYDLLPVERLQSDLSAECLVCHEQFVKGKEIQTIRACEHTFHPECLGNWLDWSEHKNCPTCRNPVGTIEPPTS
jgi:hypothetical protein